MKIDDFYNSVFSDDYRYLYSFYEIYLLIVSYLYFIHLFIIVISLSINLIIVCLLQYKSNNY